MSKKQATLVIIAAVCAGWLFNLLAGGYLDAKISTWPLLNRWKILSPQAPIVINNRQTVYTSDSGDTRQAADSAAAKISTLVLVTGNSYSVVGSAVNLTSDGSFVTAASSFSNKSITNYSVVLSNGTMAQVSAEVLDPATSLVFFKTSLSGVPTASLGDSGDLSPGDKVVFVNNSLQDFTYKILASTVNSGQDDVDGQLLQSDYPSRSFTAAADGSLASGEAVVNTNGDIVGVWNGSQIISSDVLKQAAALYFNDPGQIVRPSFGFSYSIITQNSAALTGLIQGAEVKSVAAGLPAREAGLEAGDVITAVDGQAVSESSPLEQILQNYVPGDQLILSVMRGKENLSLTLTAGVLK